MGVFDTVCVPCPGCGREHEFFSYADPYLDRFTLDNAPDVVLADISGQQQACGCGFIFAIVTKVSAKAIQLTATKGRGEAELE